MREHEVRENLIGRANAGELTPDEAEAEAKRLKLSPLAREPKRNDFDPAIETDWTLPMAVAWIAYRSPTYVTEWWDEFRHECWDWQPQVPDSPDADRKDVGWNLARRPPASLGAVQIAEDQSPRIERDPDYSLTVAEAQEALWTALQTDCFRASAISRDSGERVPILPIDWQHIRYVENDGLDELHHEASGSVFGDVLLPSAPLLSMWPKPPKGNERYDVLPEAVPPVGDGYMPLFRAALWIATEGGTRIFDPENVSNWKPTYTDLLAAIASEKVQALGTRKGQREPIPPYHFAECEVEYPYYVAPIRLILGEELYLQSYPYIDEGHWRGGLDDSLRNKSGVRWSMILVRKSDILALWPFNAQEPVKTGAPGRPTSMHLILTELEDRANEGRLEDTLKRQSEALADWLVQKHPSAARAKAKTVENGIRYKYWELKATTK